MDNLGKKSGRISLKKWHGFCCSKERELFPDESYIWVMRGKEVGSFISSL
jgi:hypothetical protein